jgi:integrase
MGTLKVVEVRPRHVHELVMTLRRTPSNRGGVLSNGTIRTVYFLTKQLFSYAMLQELVPGNPILVGRGVLPKKGDKDPGWRKTAVFNKDEVETLIYSEELPQHRRIVYAISFLTGLRPGQVYELRWGDFEPDMEPLGRISSSRSWNSYKKVVKTTKTNVDHLVPVHPVLAKVLAEWKLHGWRARHGAKPTGNDLIVPNIEGHNRDVRRTLMDFYEDLETVGLRRRRQYDARRTFASLALNGGATKDAVRAITHPRPADVFDLYVTMSWDALCAAVKCIRVELKEGKLVALPRPATVVLGSPLAGGAEVKS